MTAFPYLDADGFAIPGMTRESAIACAAEIVSEHGGVVLDDSRAIIAAAGDDTNELVRVSGDVIDHDAASRILSVPSFWWDDACDAPTVVTKWDLIAFAEPDGRIQRTA